MEAKELMIGDLVNLCYRDLTLKVIGFDSMKYTILVKIQDNFKLQISYHEREIKPIPLTEEMLKLNGFVDEEWYKGIDYTSKDDGWFVIDIESEGNVTGVITMWIRYVHELQHALRLMGRTELADNFKVE